MKPADVEWSTYIDSSKETNDEDPEFKLGHTVRIKKKKKKKKKKLQKAIFQIGLKKFLWLKKLLVILKAKKLLERFMKKNCKKTNKQIKKSLGLKK